MELPFTGLRHPLVIAHRGSELLGPENTLYTFELALQAGADVLELDLHPSADGEIMVIHDETVDRTSNGRGLVRSKTLKELKHLDFAWFFSLPGVEGYPMRGTGITIPTLGELFERFPGRALSIDIKEDDVDFALKVARLIERKEMGDRVVLSSFHPPLVARLRAESKRLRFGADRGRAIRLLAASRLGVPASLLNPADAYLLPYHAGPLQVPTRALIRKVHALERRLYVWTVDEPALMRRLLERGADGLISNRPDLAFQVRRELFG